MIVWLVLAAGALRPLGGPALAQSQAAVTSPEKFFGFQMGADRKIARWDRIVEYYRVLAKESPRIQVTDLGPSTEGHPFLLVTISSPANLAKLERLRDVNRKISDPRGLAEAEVRKLVAEGKAVICQTMSLHATEIGGTQMAPELAYDLLSRQDEETRRILDNVVFLMVPSFNPDGAIIVADWYQKTLGTTYEGSGPPVLYQKYSGHDNNRDAFQGNLVESRYLAKVMFRDWSVPQAYIDHHHMGSYGARIYVPPYAEPVRPLADPLVWREHSWYGAHIAYKAEEGALSGVINMSQYSGWGHFGFHWITPFHNIAGMLTESASARLATPLFIRPEQLQGNTRGLPKYEEQTTFPNPWPGGWWRLRDIVERQKMSAWATLDLAARNKETVLWNAYLKAKRQTERGAAGKPLAYVIPAAQHDPLTANKLVNKLLDQGIEVRQAPRGFTTASGNAYGPGSFIVPLAQPKMGLIRYLLGQTFYPDNSYTRSPDGTPIRPYDMATDTMAEFMGVRVDPTDEPIPGELAAVSGVKTAGNVGEPGAGGYVLDGRLNDSFKAVNLLLAKGVAVQRVDKPGPGARAGDFLVTATADTALLSQLAADLGVDFRAAGGNPGARPSGGSAELLYAVHPLKAPRIAMYQRYWGGNMDEGWTRLLLEQFSFPYTSVLDAEIRKGDLTQKYDVLILPDDSAAMITGERPAGGGMMRQMDGYPPEYRSGIGTEGVEAIKAFVQKGGTLVALGGSTAFAIEKFGLPVRHVLTGVSTKDFWCPGSTLHARFDHTQPLAYGMPAEGLVVFLSGTQVFDVAANNASERYESPVRFAEHNLLRSGWLVGEQYIARKTPVVATAHGEGRIVLLGIRAQHRAQTHGTFKLLFNALLK